MQSPRFAGSVEYWEDRYRRGKTSGAGSYNRLAEHKAEIQTVLYVLEMVKFEVLHERYKALFSAPEEPKPGAIRFGKPEEKE